MPERQSSMPQAGSSQFHPGNEFVPDPTCLPPPQLKAPIEVSMSTLRKINPSYLLGSTLRVNEQKYRQATAPLPVLLTH